MTDLERYLDDFGAALHRARPPKRGRRSFALGGALAVATAAVVALLLLAPAGGSRPGGPIDAVAAVRKALDPSGVILHMRVRSDAPPGVGGVQRSFQETWSAQAPQRWHLRQWGLVGKSLHRRPAPEMAYGGGEQSDYNGKRLRIQRGYKDNTPQTRLPNLFSATGGDPDTDLRALLSSGKLRDEGEMQVGGRTVRRLSRDERGIRTLVFDVDPVTFAPLGGTLNFFRRAGQGKPLFTFTFVVEAFERLPITTETEKLLTIAPPAGTRTVVVTAAQMRARERRRQAWRKQCVHHESGRVTCPPVPARKQG
jgi:hypothetical protein